jgi:hypothetical protein
MNITGKKDWRSIVSNVASNGMKKYESKEERRERMLKDAKAQCDIDFVEAFTEEEVERISALMCLYNTDDLNVSEMTQKEMFANEKYCTSMRGLSGICMKVVDVFADEKVDIFSNTTCSSSFELCPTKMVQIFIGRF